MVILKFEKKLILLKKKKNLFFFNELVIYEFGKYRIVMKLEEIERICCYMWKVENNNSIKKMLKKQKLYKNKNKTDSGEGQSYTNIVTQSTIPKSEK